MANKNNSVFTRLPVVAALAFICCFLWGSAASAIKIGYSLFSVQADDTASQLLFAGLRFTVAGVMVVVVGSLVRRKKLIPRVESVGRICILSVFQTVLQYILFYIGVAHASGVKSSIMTSTSVFFALFVSALVFHFEKLSLRKVLGCVLGFSGVILINVAGLHGSAPVSFAGEGCLILSQVAYAVSSCLVKKYSGGEDPLTLSGWQFILGGLVLVLVGSLLGGHLQGWSAASVGILSYLSFISAMAYSLWSILLQYNPVSRVSVFGFLNPLCGVVIAAVILHEAEQAFNIAGLCSLLLVCLGITVVNTSGRPASGRNAESGRQ